MNVFPRNAFIICIEAFLAVATFPPERFLKRKKEKPWRLDRVRGQLLDQGLGRGYVGWIDATRTTGEERQREGRPLGTPDKPEHITRGKTATAQIWSHSGLPDALSRASGPYPLYTGLESA